MELGHNPKSSCSKGSIDLRTLKTSTHFPHCPCIVFSCFPLIYCCFNLIFIFKMVENCKKKPQQVLRLFRKKAFHILICGMPLFLPISAMEVKFCNLDQYFSLFPQR